MKQDTVNKLMSMTDLEIAEVEEVIKHIKKSRHGVAKIEVAIDMSRFKKYVVECYNFDKKEIQESDVEDILYDFLQGMFKNKLQDHAAVDLRWYLCGNGTQEFMSASAK
jgi:hypothetical protein